MKNSTKRLLVSLGFLAIALIVTTTTTFAWFSFNNKVSVTGISATVTAQDGLYISTTETGVYGTTLVASNCFINGVDGTTVGAAKYELKDLTTTDSGATLKTKLGAAAQAYAAATTEPAVAEKKGAYVEFAFWLKSSSNYDVYLAKESTVTSSHTGTIGGAGNTPDIKAWDAITTATYSNDTAITGTTTIAKGDSLVSYVKAANAARVAFTIGSTQTNWNPNSDKGFNVSNLAAAYNNYLNNTTETVTEVAGTPSSTLMPTETEGVVDVTGKTKLGNVAGVATKVTVRVWLEGTDGDCFNQILADTLNATLSLYGAYLG